MTQQEIHDMEHYMDRFESLRHAERAWMDEEREVESAIAVANATGDTATMQILRSRLQTMRLVHEHCIRHEIEDLLGVDLHDIPHPDGTVR
jgi:hypothetical protein